MTALLDRLGASFGGAAMGASPMTGMPLVAPDSIGMAAEILQFAAREHLQVLPAGACEHLPPGARADFVLSTRRLVRIGEYEPEEMVVVAEAGLTLHALASMTAPHRQRLGPTPWPGRAATLGGAVAAARAGLDRRGRGAMRDVVLGARVLHADGRISKTGGKVVKNVTGYDLAKLYTGSFGSLAMLLELNLRLVPMPERSALLAATVPVTRTSEYLLALHRAALAPQALLMVAGEVPGWTTTPDLVHIVMRLEGSEASAAAQTSEAARLVPGLAPVADPQAWDALQQWTEPHSGTIVVQIASLPVEGPTILERMATLPVPPIGCVAQFGVGVTHARFAATAPMHDLDAVLMSSGAHFRVLYAPSGVGSLGTPVRDPFARQLMQKTKQALDPAGCFPPVPQSEVGG